MQASKLHSSLPVLWAQGERRVSSYSFALDDSCLHEQRTPHSHKQEEKAWSLTLSWLMQ